MTRADYVKIAHAIDQARATLVVDNHHNGTRATLRTGLAATVTTTGHLAVTLEADNPRFQCQAFLDAALDGREYRAALATVERANAAQLRAHLAREPGPVA